MSKKNKGKVSLRGDIVKDDSGSYAVFTGQSSSASQMTAAKVMDVIQGYQTVQDKQQTQQKMLQNCSKFQSQNVQIFGYDYHDPKGQNHGPVRKTRCSS